MNDRDKTTSRMSSHIQTATGAAEKFQQASNARPIHRNAPVNVKLVVKRRIAVAMSVAVTLIAILCDGFSINSLANV